MVAASFSWSLGGVCGTTHNTEDFGSFPFNRSTEGPQKMHGGVFSEQIVGHSLNDTPIKWSRKLLHRLARMTMKAPWVTNITICKHFSCVPADWEMDFVCDGSVDRPHFLSPGWALGFPEPRELSPTVPLLLLEAYDIDIDVFGKARALKRTYRARLRGVYAPGRCIGRDGGQPRTASAREGEGSAM